jgi:CheY-like chemotaxis protein
MNAPHSSFDGLYIHYDKINEEELKKIGRHHRSHSNIILVTKLNKRTVVQDISSHFSKVLYEPITFSKVEKSFHYLIEHKVEKEGLVDKKLTLSKNSTKRDKTIFKGLHALVVEDNPINQKMIHHTLKNMGITSVCANHGQEGLEMYMKNSHMYDVVFMDIQMPVMNGLDATKAIIKYEEESNLQHTPIIAVTANALKGDRERFMAEGMDEYVSKPIDLEKFITALKIFFPIEPEVESVLKTKKDILLYKETTTEAKIISAILNKLEYSVDVVENIEELKKVIDIHSYKCILLDKVHSDTTHNRLTQQIKSKNIPSLLFVDSQEGAILSDKEDYTFVTNKLTDYGSIKEKVDHMIALDKVS